MTLAPSLASRRAWAAPCPLAAPVTIATLPATRPVIFLEFLSVPLAWRFPARRVRPPIARARPSPAHPHRSQGPAADVLATADNSARAVLRDHTSTRDRQPCAPDRLTSFVHREVGPGQL